MYDGHSDPKQFLMSYEATISSYGGNTVVMAKSFIMAVRSVAQTLYSSLRPGTITSWQKLKDMLVTSFQGFQTKLVTAQALFQCTQDHEEYLQAYVRRFLRLRAQAPTVPNEIVIDAMIKGLRPGPTTQYFSRKPPQTLEKLLQKMYEYIRTDNDFRQRREEAYRFSEMTRGFGERLHLRHVRSIHNSNANDERKNNAQSNHHSFSRRACNRLLTGHQHREAEEEEASVEEGLLINPGSCIAFSIARTRATQQGRARLQSRSKRKLLKPRRGRVSQSKSSILLRVILHASQNM
jgi:predicted phosphodiesterase